MLGILPKRALWRCKNSQIKTIQIKKYQGLMGYRSSKVDTRVKPRSGGNKTPWKKTGRLFPGRSQASHLIMSHTKMLVLPPYLTGFSACDPPSQPRQSPSPRPPTMWLFYTGDTFYKPHKMKYRWILNLNIKSAELMKRARAFSIIVINSLKIPAYTSNWLTT